MLLAGLALLLAPGPAIALPDAASAPAAMAPRPPRSRGITVAIPAARKASDIRLPRVDGPRDPERPLIIIDAGHGGHDPGAINTDHGWREKDLTLAIARAIRAELLATGRFRVALTRDSDDYLLLQERYGIARQLGADLLLSIHADAAPRPEANGASVYTLSEVASDREAARLAARENKADILNGIDLSGTASNISSILIDLTQRETMEAATRFANLLVREAAPFVRFQPRARHFASLVVLKSPDTPSILFETGYISNEDDARRLRSAAGQRAIATGVTRAVRLFFARPTTP